MHVQGLLTEQNQIFFRKKISNPSQQTLIYQLFLSQLANTIFNQSKDVHAAHQGLCQPGEGCTGFHFQFSPQAPFSQHSSLTGALLNNIKSGRQARQFHYVSRWRWQTKVKAEMRSTQRNANAEWGPAQQGDWREQICSVCLEMQWGK